MVLFPANGIVFPSIPPHFSTTVTSPRLQSPVLFTTIVAISFIGLFELLRVFKLQWKPIGIVGYIATVYYLFTMVQKDMKSAETIAASIMGLNPKEAAAYRLYYQEEDFANIDVFPFTSTFPL